MKIKDNSGVCVDEPAQIESKFIIDFITRFKSDQVVLSNIEMDMLNLVTVEDNQRLLELIQDSEIKDAIFQTDKFKAPGSDSFGAAFFQDYWHIIKDEVCHAVRSFFEEEKLLK